MPCRLTLLLTAVLPGGPPDAAARRRAPPVLTYSVEQLPSFDAAFYNAARAELSNNAELTVLPREAKAYSTISGGDRGATAGIFSFGFLVSAAVTPRGSVPGGGDALTLAIRLCLPGLRRAASQLRQDPGALPVYRLSAADIRDRRNDFRSNQGAAVHLVSRHVPPHSEQGRHLQH
jgi:hypothetical protein